MCGECGELLEHVSSYEFNGRPYCHLDYHDVSLMGIICGAGLMSEIRTPVSPLQDPHCRAPIHYTR
jgi:hypothetical protein